MWRTMVGKWRRKAKIELGPLQTHDDIEAVLIRVVRAVVSGDISPKLANCLTEGLTGLLKDMEVVSVQSSARVVERQDRDGR